MSKPPPGYLHTDELQELLDALRKVRTELEAARTSDAILALLDDPDRRYAEEW